MQLAGYTIQDVLYAVDETVVARAQAASGETVALKYQDTVHPALDITARWQHEHDVLRDIDSPWIIKTFGMTQVDSRQVLVLEYFTSVNLAQLIAEHDLDLSARLAIALQLAAAVSDVHRHHLIHCDISPKNVLVDIASLKLKICDFGLCTRLEHETKRDREPSLRGTLEYMSPEQTGRTNLDVDYRSDFYSLGVTLYELFLGQKPFQSNDPMTLLHSHIAIVPTPLHAADPSLPEPLSNLVQKLLAKGPDDRYQSSVGLIADLEHCAQQWQHDGRIDRFELGREDIPERFCIAHLLYGREQESQAILRAFDRASVSRAELLLIGGYAGVGKTALVNELNRPILARRGYFLHGKCDQYSRNQPFAALIQAFAPLMRQLLGEGAQRRHYWKLALQKALGENAAAITDIIPELALIMGAPAPLQTLPAAERENRFHIAFAQFVKALSADDHPLALFLDDLQWIDLPTLKLLERQLVNDEERALLIIGAYRDNEVDAAHPLMLTVRAIEQARAPVQHLHLAPLSLAQVLPMVADTLRRSQHEVAALAALCVQKTDGNPFFLTQFLRSLHEGGEIFYDRQLGGWQWDLAQIQQRAISNNVVDLMLQKTRQLTPATQSLLALAAHLGGSFDMRQLMAVNQQDASATAATLWPALQAGLVVPLGDDYKFDSTPLKLQQSRYRFLHDRVQQAAYSLTPSGQRAALQLTTGRMLLASTPEDELDERLFVILEQLNQASALITDPQERAVLLRLNLRGGVKAKAASAWPSAVSLLRHAQWLLPPDAWSAQPEQTLSVHKELAEALYLSGDFAAAEQLYAPAIALAPDAIAKVTLCLVQVDHYHIQGRFNESLAVLLQALSLLGEPFPASNEEAGPLFAVEFGHTEALLAQRSHAQLLDAPEMTHSARLLVMRVYFALSFASYQTGQFALFLLDACRMVQTTLKHGQCELSCVAYVAYVTAMSAMGKPYPQCYDMGKLAMTLADRRDSKYFRLTVYQYFAPFYQHWCEPLENSFALLERGMEWGQEGINLLSAGYCALLLSVNQMVKGVRLDELENECEQGLRFLQNSHQPHTENMLRYGVWLPVLALQGKTLAARSFDTASVSASAFFKGDYQTPSIPLALYSAAMIRHAYLLDDAVQWQQCAANLGVIAMCLPDSPALVDATFYVALGLLNPTTASGASEGTPSAQNLAQAQQYSDKFKTWALGCEANFEHKSLLIGAEIARVQGNNTQAMDLYARAIDAARRADFPACEALANELYARFWLGQQQNQLASIFIQEAHYHYGRWGAALKCGYLVQQWPQVAFGLSERRRNVSSKTTTYKMLSGKADMLDLHSLLKANQLLAQEVSLDALLERMMGVLLENAGAEQGAIVLDDDGRLQLEVLGKMGAGQQLDKQRVSLTLAEACEREPPLLPHAIIAYVRDTLETLVLNQPAHDQRFRGDRYLALHEPKSVMSLPIVRQGKLVAVLYLENNLLEHAFTAKHQQTLALLSAQAAISLINARLYDSLEEKVLQRTEQLRQMSMKDGLTGIANRRSFDERLAGDWARSLRSGKPLSLLMVDIDHFKQYNDHFGHLEGDNCIRAVAKALERAVSRGLDFVARYGGEEFAILLEDTQTQGASRVAKACLRAVARLAIPHADSSAGQTVSISIGIRSMLATPQSDTDMLIRQADRALYQAKRDGRNRYSVFVL